MLTIRFPMVKSRVNDLQTFSDEKLKFESDTNEKILDLIY